jgi:hypothetical protein
MGWLLFVCFARGPVIHVVVKHHSLCCLFSHFFSTIRSLLLNCVEHTFELGRTVRGPDSPRLWAGRSVHAQSSLGFRVLCYGC